MKRFWSAVKRFFAPPPDSKTLTRVLPYAVVAFLVVVLFVFSASAWEYTNQTSFCGLTCHTMPPEYQTQQLSAHANVTCEDCHLGRSTLNVMIPRKLAYSWETGSAMITGLFKYPIFAKNMRPAREACENCHEPEKFSSDKLIEIKRFADNETNTLTTLYLLMKTGGGTQRQGLGYGIHWHIENPVYYYATDPEQQTIPYVVVTNSDGTTTSYVDVEANFDPSTVKKEDMHVMDCITCHNRTAHDILTPSKEMDDLMGRGLVSSEIPEIHERGAQYLGTKYDSEQQAFTAIEALGPFYQQYYPDFAKYNQAKIDSAIAAIKDAYHNSVYLDQKVDWTTHPDNIQHMDSPGCFRCHDGKHQSVETGGAIRLECNLCHSIPTISNPTQLVSDIPVSKGIEPDSHTNPNWINLHRNMFDSTCQSCHTVDDPGGTSNTSFCSNSICHGSDLKYVGLDAPKVREIIQAQMPTPAPTPIPTATPQGGQPTQASGSGSADPTYDSQIGAIFQSKCAACHGTTGMKGLTLTTYAGVMKGSSDGAVIVPGNPDESLLVKVQSAGGHPGQLSPEQLTLVKQWITAGAPEK